MAQDNLLRSLLINRLYAPFPLDGTGKNICALKLVAKLRDLRAYLAGKLLKIEIGRQVEAQIALVAIHPAGKLYLRLMLVILLQG
ncbi:hypothetical protein D3C76_1506920 [compost metagenome]